MDSLIRETNENLKAIINTMKSNLDNSINTLDNIQIQMDKKVEEAKKYKIQVDSAKDKIKEYEESNKSLELSLKELNEKYGKMNLVSLVEAGNKEIKTKINDNNREINKLKENIADLTNKARTIKDLLINLKKDKTIKETRLENIKTAYEYYNERINEICDYAFNHSENLNDYMNNIKYEEETEEIITNTDLENTMVFDEIANIDDNKNFKDEMTFINDQIDETVNTDKITEIIKNNLEKYNITNNIEEDEEVKIIDKELDTTQVFDTIFETSENEEKINSDELEYTEENDNKETPEILENNEETNNFDLEINKDVIDTELEPREENKDEVEIVDSLINENEENNSLEEVNTIENKEEIKEEPIINSDLFINSPYEITDNIEIIKPLEEIELNKETEIESIDNLEDNIKEPEEVVENKLDILNIDNLKNNEEEIEDNEDRISKINDLFSSLDNTSTTNLNLDNLSKVNNIEKEIDNAYLDVFGNPLEENDLNKKESTLTDIFGNPIKHEDLSEDIKTVKKIEELFVENGIDFNKFKEDEQNYLKQIYDEEKFNNILNTLKRNKINIDNIYNAFNIFGEISANELESIISKLIVSGQSLEAIGLILEKLPKVKKYDLNAAIESYGDYIKDIDITELIMKAKELYDNGGNN